MIVTRSIIPNLLTLANLFCGFASLIQSSQHNFYEAGLFILLAAVFDMLDGMVARLINSTSELGVELDSLCDAVSFGVAPSFMLYMAILHQMGEWGVLLASFPALAGVYRLARFNVQVSSFEDKVYFRGMPIPAGALTICSYIVFYSNHSFIPFEYKLHTAIAVSILTSFVMISTIRFDHIPKPTRKDFKLRPFFFLFFTISFVIILISKDEYIFPVLLLYIFLSVTRQIYAMFYSRFRKEIDDETIEQPSESDPFEDDD